MRPCPHLILSGGFSFRPKDSPMKKVEQNSSTFFMAGDEGFEPPITGPEPGALPLGQSPMDSQVVKSRIVKSGEFG